MANHKSAAKRHRQIVKRTASAGAYRSRVRRAIKKARLAIEAGGDDAAELVKTATKLLDRVASKNVLPAARASRLKSRLALALNKSKSSKS